MARDKAGQSDGLPLALIILSAFAFAGAAAVLLAKRTTSSEKKARRRVLGVIPARYESQRFPGKPLVDILGKPMVVRTWEQAKKAESLEALVVATDDKRIADACRSAGADVVMTRGDCPNGTERCHEAASHLREEYDIVINIQGDEPLIDPHIIDDCVRALQSSPDAVYSTACTPMDASEVPLAHRVKVILDKDGYAIYFSRGMLPSNKSGKPRPFPEPFASQPYFLHLGIACFDRQFLQKYCNMPPTPHMLMEDLEQLKVIENGFRIKVITVDHCAHGVDEPGDVDSIIAKMRELDMQ